MLNCDFNSKIYILNSKKTFEIQTYNEHYDKLPPENMLNNPRTTPTYLDIHNFVRVDNLGCHNQFIG